MSYVISLYHSVYLNLLRVEPASVYHRYIWVEFLAIFDGAIISICCGPRPCLPWPLSLVHDRVYHDLGSRFVVTSATQLQLLPSERPWARVCQVNGLWPELLPRELPWS